MADFYSAVDIEANLDRPESLKAAFEGAHGVFLVTNFWEQGTDELKQATAAVRAAKDAGVKHFIWSTLPDVEAISSGKLHVPHFTGKAKVDQVVKEAGFPHDTFVIAPFFYQNLVGALAPQKQEDGTLGWALPIDPTVRGIHMGDITQLGDIVAGAFAHPDEAGNGEYLPLVGDFMSFNEIIETLNRQGHKLSFKQIPEEVFAASFPGAADVAATFSHFEANTYLGSDLARGNCARKQGSGQAVKKVRNLGEGKFPGSEQRGSMIDGKAWPGAPVRPVAVIKFAAFLQPQLP